MENLLFSVEFKLSKHVFHHIRSVYTLFDLLGDVGGLFDALKGIMSTVVAFYFFIFGNPMHEYLLKALFINDNKQRNSRKERLLPIPQRIQQLTRRTSFELSKVCCTRCRSQKEKKLISKGMLRIQRELEVKRFLKQSFETKIALKALFTKTERFLIRHNRAFVINANLSDKEDYCNSP